MAIGRILFLYNILMASIPPKTAKAAITTIPIGDKVKAVRDKAKAIGPNARSAINAKKKDHPLGTIFRTI